MYGEHPLDPALHPVTFAHVSPGFGLLSVLSQYLYSITESLHETDSLLFISVYRVSRVSMLCIMHPYSYMKLTTTLSVGVFCGVGLCVCVYAYVLIWGGCGYVHDFV